MTKIRLSVASGERHDGTSGNGTRIVRTGDKAITVTTDTETVIEWWEIDMNGNGDEAVQVNRAADITVANCIIHDGASSAGGTAPVGVKVGGTGGDPGTAQAVINCFIYDMHATGGTQVAARGILNTGGNYTCDVLNCSILHIKSDSTSGASNGIARISGTMNAKNVVIADCASGSTSGNEDCFSGTIGTSATNASDDSTAPSPIASEPIVASTEFVSTTAGSEDLHLKSGAECIDVGTDLATTPSGVQFDIDNRDRDTQGDTWDVGADEFVAVASTLASMRQMIGHGVGAR